MNNRLGLALFIWETFALVLALTIYKESVPEGLTPRGDLFWWVFVSVSLFGWALFFLVTGFIKYTKKDDR